MRTFLTGSTVQRSVIPISRPAGQLTGNSHPIRSVDRLFQAHKSSTEQLCVDSLSPSSDSVVILLCDAASSEHDFILFAATRHSHLQNSSEFLSPSTFN